MYPFRVLTHDQLVTLAHQAQAAAHDRDAGRVEAAALKLLLGLADHIGAERPGLLRLPPAEARILERGQQRIIHELVELAATGAGTPDHCRCAPLADNLLAELTLQAEDERRHLVAPT